jgi:hypothetical protein
MKKLKSGKKKYLVINIYWASLDDEIKKSIVDEKV